MHNRLGEPCPQCATPIARVDFEEHTIYYCPACQTGGRLLKDRGRGSALARGVSRPLTSRCWYGGRVTDVRLDEDLQASAPEIALALSRAGVSGVQKAVRIRRGDAETVMAATIDCTVDLASDQKGVHMSRFPELFEEAIELVVVREGMLVEALSEQIASKRGRAAGGAPRRGLDPRAVADAPPHARDRPQDPGDGHALRDRRRVGDGDSPRGRRRGERDQRVPVRAGPRPEPRERAAARGRVRGDGRGEDPRARPASRRTTSAAARRSSSAPSRTSTPRRSSTSPSAR